MAIKRIDVGPRMSQAVICNNMVYLAGIVAQSNKGKSVREQTTEILATIDKYLQQAGTDKDQADLDQYLAVRHQELFRDE
jgi:enamine deaminase RidA (YjgF/YER057c/UK114 family)